MTKKLFLAAFAVCLTSAAPALADSHDLFGYWTAPNNGTLSAVMMQDGDVMMKIKLPEKEFGAISRDMKTNHESCNIEQIYPDAKDTMILVCRAG